MKDDRNITTTLKIDQNKGLFTEEQIKEMTEENSQIREDQIKIEKIKLAINDLKQYIAKVKKETKKFNLSQENINHLDKLIKETQQWLSNPNSVLELQQVEAQHQFLEQEWKKLTEEIDIFN